MHSPAFGNIAFIRENRGESIAAFCILPVSRELLSYIADVYLCEVLSIGKIVRSNSNNAHAHRGLITVIIGKTNYSWDQVYNAAERLIFVGAIYNKWKFVFYEMKGDVAI